MAFLHHYINTRVIVRIQAIKRDLQLADIGTAPRPYPQLHSMGLVLHGELWFSGFALSCHFIKLKSNTGLDSIQILKRGLTDRSQWKNTETLCGRHSDSKASVVVILADTYRSIAIAIALSRALKLQQSVCVCVFITAVPITELFAGEGGRGEMRTCATRDDEPRPVWTSLPIAH